MNEKRSLGSSMFFGTIFAGILLFSFLIFCVRVVGVGKVGV